MSKKISMLLFTAGITDVTTVDLEETESSFTLKSLCRDSVRKYLLESTPINLFISVPQLELPVVIIEYLLYDVSLE